MEITANRSLVPVLRRTARLAALLAPLAAVSAACGGASADAPAAPAPAAAAAPADPAPAHPAPAPSTAAASAEADPLTTDRFDLLVRDDFFAGLLHQDTAALDRAMKLCEDTLARDPNHAEAMVWHGGGLIMRAGVAFRAGDRQRGGELWVKGLAEMDRAIQIQPDKVGTRIPRGATLLAVAQFVPEPERGRLLEKAVGDYERALALQKDHFDRLSSHARSQLLYGLADGWHRRGDESKARAYYQQLQRVAGTSPYGERARAYLAGDTASRAMACGGCHAN